MASNSNLIWIDLEMTGLDTTQDKIIEIAIIVTNSDLETVAVSPVIAIHQSDELLNNMDAWNTEHHTQSGLVQRVKASTINETEAEQTYLAFLPKYHRFLIF